MSMNTQYLIFSIISTLNLYFIYTLIYTFIFIILCMHAFTEKQMIILYGRK